MRLTKEKLKQIIKEELESIRENPEEFGNAKATTAQVRSGALAAAAAQGEQGITNDERGVIQQLVGLLGKSAQNTNLLSGTIITKIKQLADELQKVLPQQTQTGAQE
jgi:hypothetical protein